MSEPINVNSLLSICDQTDSLIEDYTGQAFRSAKRCSADLRDTCRLLNKSKSTQDLSGNVLSVVEQLGKLLEVVTDLRYSPGKTLEWKNARTNLQQDVFDTRHAWRSLLHVSADVADAAVA